MSEVNTGGTTETTEEELTILDKVKAAIDVVDTDYDDELQDLIEAAQGDLAMAGVTETDTTEAMIRRYIILYCRCFFRTPPDFAQLDRARDDLLKRLAKSTGYTDYSAIEEDEEEAEAADTETDGTDGTESGGSEG